MTIVITDAFKSVGVLNLICVVYSVMDFFLLIIVFIHQTNDRRN